MVLTSPPSPDTWLIFAFTLSFSLLVFCCVRWTRSAKNHRQESQVEQYRSFLRIPPGQLLRGGDNYRSLSVYATNMLQQAMQYTSLAHFLQWSEVAAAGGGGGDKSPESSLPAPAMFDIVLAYYKVNPIDWLLELAKTLRVYYTDIFPSQVRIFVYAKATDPGDPPFDAAAIRNSFPESWRDRLVITPLQNVGRCDHTYVYHIVKHVFGGGNSDNPSPDPPTSRYTVFLKDRTTRDVKLDWLVQRFANPPSSFSGVANESVWADLAGTATADYIPKYRHSHAYYTLHDQNQNRDTFLTAPEFLQPLHTWMQAIMQDPGFSVDKYADPQYKGIFMVPTEQIRRVARDTWIRAGISLCYGRNIETGHYMERVWATLLGASEKKQPSTPIIPA